MFRSFRMCSIQVEILAPLTLLIVAIAVFNAIYFSNQQSSLISLAFEERLKKIADIISLGTGVSLRSGELEVVRATVDRVKEDRDLAFLLIFDKDAAELIRHGDVHKARMDRTQFFALPEKRMQKRGDYLVRKDRIVFGDEELGFSIVGLYARDREAAVAENVRITLLASALIALAGIGVLVVLSQALVVKPVLHLSATAERIARGDLSPEIAPYHRRDDEIGQLYSAFGTMVEKLRAATENLQEEIRARTAKLQASELQLERQNQELARLNTYKSRLLSVVSHELKTPLAALDGFARLIDQIFLTDEFIEEFASPHREKLEQVRKRVAIMGHNTTRLIRLVDELLDFSRIDQGRDLEMNRSPTDVGKILMEAVEVYREMGARKGLAVRYEGELALEGLWAVVDADRIAQVFDNLLNNAIKFTEAGDGVRVRTRQVGNYLEFQVWDSGEGIEAEALERIFGLFEQAGNTAFRKQGTGIGLAISKHIVEKHGGYIRATSEGVGLGSCFTFGIPRRQGEG